MRSQEEIAVRSNSLHPGQLFKWRTLPSRASHRSRCGCTAVSQRLFCAQLVDLRRAQEAILSSAYAVDTNFESSSFKCHRCTSDFPQPNVHEVIVQLGQVLNGSQHDCLGRVLMSWDSSNSPFFSSPSQMHSIPPEMTT